MILEIRDTGGTGYTLAHAINNQTDHKAVNIRAQKSFINYPALIEMGDYDPGSCKKTILKSDVIVFNGVFQPFYEAFNLKAEELKDKKKLFLCMGSEWRWGRKKLVEEADRLMQKYQVVLGGAGMFLPNPAKPEEDAYADQAEYLPVVRSFDELNEKFTLCNQDRQAIQTFAVPKKRVIFTHAPTSEEKKGSKTFFHAITRAMQVVDSITTQTIRHQSWFTTLSLLASSNVVFDQDAPFPTAYGAISVEASAFKVPVVTQVYPECREWIEKKTGLRCPYIGWKDPEDLFMKIVNLGSIRKKRRKYGKACYEYGRALHDEKPVVSRFLKIIDGMD